MFNLSYGRAKLMAIRQSRERKFFDHGWLRTYHTFSFASYYDPKFMGFRDLRVINEDRVDANHGFPAHSHRDMEIISIVLDGELAHKDSMGNESVLHTNEIQVMSAGTGIVHSEFNPSKTHPVHFLQIWIEPDTTGIEPRYKQAKLPTAPNEWHLLASKQGPLPIQQDASLYYLHLEKGQQAERSLPANRYGWLQVMSGDLAYNNASIHTGDGVSIEPNTKVTLLADSPSRLLFFDLP